MKRIIKVTILFILIISFSVIPSFAIGEEDNGLELLYRSSNFTSYSFDAIYNFSYCIGPTGNRYYSVCKRVSEPVIYFFIVGESGVSGYDLVLAVDDDNYNLSSFSGQVANFSYPDSYVNVNNSNFNNYSQTYGLHYYSFHRTNKIYSLNNGGIFFDTLEDGFSAISDVINTPIYSKNTNVDEFIANTLISMGVKFKTSSSGISIAQAAWDYMTDEQSLEGLDRLHKAWDIESAVSYCNAQSNNYKDWYNGYKVSKDVTLALTAFLDYNYEITGTRPNTVATIAGIEVDNFNQNYMPLDSSMDPVNISSYTFYAAQTITYANGEYLYDNDVIDPLQFDYTPAQVRQFIGYPPAGTITIPSDPDAGTGTIIDDPNTPGRKNIEINFPSLDWLADAIKSILDFLRDAFTTLANLLTQLLDAILGLFSDAFESLTEFGQGIIEWLYAIIAGFSTIGSSYIPASLWAVILPFILINIGVGLIMFVMRSH